MGDVRRPHAADPLAEIRVHECWEGLTPRELAQLLCDRYLAWRFPPRQGYAIVDFPDAPRLGPVVFIGVTARAAFDNIAGLAGGGCVVDSARRILYCAVEGSE